MDGERRHDHDRDDERGPDRSEKAQGDQQAAAQLGQRGGGGEGAAGPEPQRFEEPAGAGETVASEPAEQLLGAVTSHEEA
jgi:hypothetical protein